METPKPQKEILDKLRFDVVQASSQDPEHPATELLSYR